MSTILVSVAAGRVVKDPRGRVVPEKFSVNPDDPFWARRIASGDLVAVAETAATPAKAPDAKGVAS